MASSEVPPPRPWERELLEKAYLKGQHFRLTRHLLNWGSDNFPGAIECPKGLARALEALSMKVPSEEELLKAAATCPAKNAPGNHADCRELAARVLKAESPAFGRDFSFASDAQRVQQSIQGPSPPVAPAEFERALIRKLTERASAPRMAFRKLFPDGTLSESSLTHGLRSLNMEPSEADIRALVEKHNGSRKSLESALFSDQDGSQEQGPKPPPVAPDQERSLPAPRALDELKHKLQAKEGSQELRRAFRECDEDLSNALTPGQFHNLLAGLNLRLDRESFDMLWHRICSNESGRVTLDALLNTIDPERKQEDQDFTTGTEEAGTSEWAGMPVDRLSESVHRTVASREEVTAETGPRKPDARLTWRESERAVTTPALKANEAEKVLRQKASDACYDGASAVRHFLRRFDRQGSGSIDLGAFGAGLREFNVLPHEDVRFALSVCLCAFFSSFLCAWRAKGD